MTGLSSDCAITSAARVRERDGSARAVPIHLAWSCHGLNRNRAPGYRRGFFLGTPLVWHSAHFTVWMLCGLFALLKVVSMASTFNPQFESCG